MGLGEKVEEAMTAGLCQFIYGAQAQAFTTWVEFAQ